MKAVAAVLVAFILIFAGCAMPWEQKQPEPKKPAQVAPQPAPAVNSTMRENITLKNETAIKKNKTVVKPIEKPDPFAGISPRNQSDRIEDGQFRVNEIPGAPLNIYFINDGNADAVLVNKGDFYMLIDAGNSQPVLDFLGKMGIMRLNVIVATRDSPGAIDGLAEVLEAYPVEEFWDNNVQSNQNLVSLIPASTKYSELLANVEKQGITVKHPQAGDRVSVSGIDIAVLNPQSPRMRGNPDVDAIVLKLSFNNFCALLLNPTVQEAEALLVGKGEDLRCQVASYFKHGEGRPTPSLLMENYQPEQVVISVGGNSEGLPSQTTLTRLSLKGVKVWRTDLDGTVRVYSDGFSGYEVSAAK
jgi:competence protein ComEC